LLELETKKVFDRTICFTFFGNWLDSLEQMENEHSDQDAAYQMFKMIANYSLYEQEPELGDNPVCGALWPLLKREIDSSVQNRKRGFAVMGPTEKQIEIIRTHIKYPDASQRDLAEMLGVSKTTVNQAIQKYIEDPSLYAGAVDEAGVVDGDACVAAADDAGDTDCSIGDSYFRDSIKDSYIYGDSDSSGTGTLVQNESMEDWESALSRMPF